MSISGIIKVCLMDRSTMIDQPGIIITTLNDRFVTGLNFRSNKNIFLLPRNVHLSFPNLLEYDADSCSITKIVGANFKGLKTLKYLDLESNQIESIPSKTFEDLVSLERLDLGE